MFQVLYRYKPNGNFKVCYYQSTWDEDRSPNTRAIFKIERHAKQFVDEMRQEFGNACEYVILEIGNNE